jgi:tRNA(Ile)-lysidine synthase
MIHYISVLDRIANFIEAEQLLSPNQEVLVGYSGGPDSTCLLYALVKLGYRCTAAHLHHGQRMEADEEVETCRAFAKKLGVEFISGRADVPAMAKAMRIGLEEAGREARYAFFEQAARQAQTETVATAHTLNDHLETVILNLSRGTGMTGLRGIPARRDNIVRPLLCLSKEETGAFCANHGLVFLHDPANDDLSFSRARVRHRIVPELEHLNPSTAKSVFRMSHWLAEEDDFLNGMAAAALEQSEFVANESLAFLSKHLEVVLRRDRLTSLPLVLFRRGIRLAAKALGGDLTGVQVLKVLSGVQENRKGSVTAPEGLVTVEWNEKTISVKRRDEVEPFRRNLEIPGVIESDALGWKLSARIEPAKGQPPVRNSLSASLPMSAVRRPLFFRNIAEGDKIQPIGFTGHRKVSDLVAEAHVSQIARRRLPIVCDLVGPLWVPGVCLDYRANVSNEDARVIQVQFGEL